MLNYQSTHTLFSALFGAKEIANYYQDFLDPSPPNSSQLSKKIEKQKLIRVRECRDVGWGLINNYTMS